MGNKVFSKEKVMKPITIASVVLGVLVCAFYVHAEAAGQATIGATAPQFSLQDQDGKTVSLSDYAGKIVVLEWVNPQCPFVQRHYAAKTMITLANNYAGKSVVWIAINSTHTADNAENKSWVSQNSLTYPILNDSSGDVGKAYGAKSTPDMFIIDQSGKLVYEGAIDDDPAGDKGSDRVNYVQKALDEVLAGKPVSTSQTKSYGCSVKYGS
jgi:peroxiredoxin